MASLFAVAPNTNPSVKRSMIADKANGIIAYAMFEARNLAAFVLPATFERVRRIRIPVIMVAST